jgi:hypothetical protein
MIQMSSFSHSFVRQLAFVVLQGALQYTCLATLSTADIETQISDTVFLTREPCRRQPCLRIV